jgi:F-type H+-transporting ATPase subunit b
MMISGKNRNGFKVLALLTGIFLFLLDDIAWSAGITVLPDKSLIIQIVNFILIIYILNILLYKPIRNILIQRKERISNLEENIDTLHQKAQDKDDAYVSGIQEARTKGLNEKNALLQEAADEERDIIEEINQKAQADLAAVKEKIKKDTETVRETLQQDIDMFAKTISERILGRTV